MSDRRPRRTLLAAGAALLCSVSPARSGEPVEANIGANGGLVEVDGVQVGMLAASAAVEPGWHRLRVEAVEPRLPIHEGVGPRPIDRRSSAPLGPVEGPPVQLGPGLKIGFAEPDPTQEVGTGMIDSAEWPLWSISAPEDLMPYLEPAQASSRQGFLLRIADAAPPGTKERVSTWLFSPGGMARVPSGPGGEEEVKAWDPCLMLGRLDAEGAAWFYLPELTCGLNDDPVWTPLREQSHGEFTDWVLEQATQAEKAELKRELKQIGRDEAKAEKD